jgi:hypothetical protein
MNSEIKEKIIDKIELLQRGNEHDILLASEIKNYIKDIQCFYCFDTKKLWGYRSEHHVFWSRFANNHNRFWVGQCNKCGDNKFLYDIDTDEIIIDNCYKLFNIDDYSPITRINELIRVSSKTVDTKINNNKLIQNIVKEILPKDEPKDEPKNEPKNEPKDETIIEEPDYEVESNFFTLKVTKLSFSADIKKLSKILGEVIKANIGIPNFALLNDIEVSLTYESVNNRKERVFYRSSDNNEFFIFVIIKYIVQTKDGNFLSIFNCEKHNRNIDCYYWIYKTKNQLAIDVCKKKIKEAVENELNFMSNILQIHYNNKSLLE